MRDAKRRPVLYPFLFGAFSVLYLWSTNLEQDVPASEALRMLAFSLAGTAVVFFAFRALFKDGHRAGIATTALVAAFFSYGYVLRSIESSLRRDISSALLAAWLLVALAGLLLALRARRWAPRATPSLNLVATVFVLLNAVPIAIHEITPSAQAVSEGNGPLALPGVDASALGPKRDVYYIILDRYANVHTLQEQFGYDDSPFLDFLQNAGFYVARDSLANYPKTTHSLASTLNMTFLDRLAARMGPDSGDWQPLYDMLRGFDVERAFAGLGYRTEHIGSWWTPTSVDPYADANHVYGGTSEFSHIFLSTTMWPKVSETIGLAPYVSFEQQQYQRVLYQFQELDRIAEDPRPTFTFAHFTLPHPPYVFDAQGRFVPPSVAASGDQDTLYIHQLEYANTRVEQLVNTLTAGPDDQDPIIVIQSDEGPHPYALEHDEDHYNFTKVPLSDLQRKLRILNTYYLPGLPETGLYSSITPVNSFRLILSDYFGADLPLLPDRTWVYQDLYHPYRFTEVTDELKA